MSSSLSPLLLPPLLSALSPICMFLMQSLHLISCEPATYSFPWGPCLCILWLLRFGALQVGQSAPYPHRPQCLHLKESRQVFLTSTRGTWMMSSVNGFLPSLYPLLKAQPWHGQDGDTQSRAGAGLMLVNREDPQLVLTISLTPNPATGSGALSSQDPISHKTRTFLGFPPAPCSAFPAGQGRAALM